MNIVVCCKFVPSVDDLVTNDDKSVSLKNAEWKINEYDLHAVQSGVELAKKTGGKLIALTVGDSHCESTKLRKDLLSRGPDEMTIVSDSSFSDADHAVISKVLAAAVQKLNADIVICGEGSEDYYNQQTGIQLGERLGWNSVGNVNAISFEDGVLVVERLLEKSIEVIELSIPAVLTVTKSINVPPRPNMRNVIAAGKKPVDIIRPGELDVDTEPTMETTSILAPESVDRKHIIIDEGSTDDSVATFIRYLKTEGIL